MLTGIIVSVFPMALMYAAAKDLTRLEIPNWISVVILADYLVAALVGSVDPLVIASHLSAGAAVLLIGALLFFIGIRRNVKLFGGGDAKLLGACAVWTGWSTLLPFIFVVAMVGGVFALMVVLIRRWRLNEIALVRRIKTEWLRKLLTAEEGLPYGVAIAAGGVFLLSEMPLTAPVVANILSAWQSARLETLLT